MRKIFRIWMLLLTAALVACGGGGGEPGTSSGPQPLPLRSTAPATLTMLIGTSQDFIVEGGKSPYRVTSSNVAIATARVESGKLSVNSVAPGSATLSVFDAVGSVLQITIEAQAEDTGPKRPLFTTAPGTVNVATGEVTSYAITGGLPPYTATSSDLSIVRSIASGSTLALTGVRGGSASVVVSDTENNTQTIEVKVGSSLPFFTNAPSSVTLYVGKSDRYLLNGGSQPYQVVSSNPAVAQGTISGSALTVNAIKQGSATLRLTDSKGDAVSLAIEVVTDAPAQPVSDNPVLTSAGLRDASGAATNAISASGFTTLNVTLTSPSGAPLPNQLIVVSGDDAQVKFPEGASGLTNAAGVASIKVARASLSASGAGALTVTYSYKVGSIQSYPNGSAPPTKDVVISTYVGYQLATANIELVNLDVGSPTLDAYGTRQVSVQANFNGKPSTTPVQVNFTATCGKISPVTASTNSAGIVTTSYSAVDSAGEAQSTQGCSGKTVEISASTIGAAVATKSLNIKGAPATSISFVSATPERIFLANSGGKDTQSSVVFKLVNARGEALLGQDVVLTLKTLNGGIPKASFGTVGNLAAITVPTDSNGLVSVPVFSGSVPTNVVVNAALKSNPGVQTDSAALAIASGRAAQERVSLSIEKLSIEGFNVDGTETNVTMSLADRQGNPVPDGTVINFVTSGGVMLPPTCTTGAAAAGNSQCTVKIRSQNPRLASQNGRVQILAYAAGEEDFVDANFNNVYDCGESWSDLGTAFRDDNENNVFNTGEFSVPRAASISACGASKAPAPGNATQMPGGVSQGDNVWGAADVRQQSTIIFATSGAAIAGDATPSRLFVTIADGNGNSMPTGSDVVVKSVVGGCGALLETFAVKIANTVAPSQFSVPLSPNCKAGDLVQIEVTSPLGLMTRRAFTVQ